MMPILYLLEKEIWKPVVGYKGYYEISSYGRIKSLARYRNLITKVLHPQCSKGRRGGYLSIKVSKNGKSKRIKIHRLVLLAFTPNPESKKEVNHKNGAKADNRVDNLEWATYQENQDHSYRELGRVCWFKGRKGKDSMVSKRVDQYKDGHFIKTWDSIAEACVTLSLDPKYVSFTIRRKINMNGTIPTTGGYGWRYSKKQNNNANFHLRLR